MDAIMPRTPLTIVLMLATLIGPCLCCCTFATLFRPSNTQATLVAHVAAPQPDDDYSCPFCRKAATPVPEPTQPMPAAPAREHCPCCQERATVASIAEVPVPIVLALEWVAFLPVDPAPCLPKSNVQAPREYPPGAGMRDFLLDYCHRLRC
jgi:hypothetical protein